MNRTIRVLHLEDDPDYSDLVKCLLQRDGLEADIQIVPDLPGFELMLEAGRFDLILADYLLPSGNGLQALRIARAKAPELPFILVSGTIGEQVAIESLKAGVTDYILKQWPERLAPAIARALDEARERRERRRLETEFFRREKYFRALTEHALDVLVAMSPEGQLRYVSPSIERVLGYSPRALLGTSAFELLHPEDLPSAQARLQDALADNTLVVRLDLRVRHADGSWRYLEAIGQNRLADPDMGAVIVTLRDVSERKAAESSLQQSEHQYRLIFDEHPTPMWVADHESLAFLEVNEAAVRAYGYSREEFLRMTVKEIRPAEDVPALLDYIREYVLPSKLGQAGRVATWRHSKKDGTVINVEVKWSTISFQGRPALLAMANDITARTRRELHDTALSHLGRDLSSAASASEAARIIRAVTDELFDWDVFTLDLYSGETDTIHSLLNVDTSSAGRRFEVATSTRGGTPSKMARRIVEQGAELILRKDPLTAQDTVPFGDTSRLSASLAVVPIRSRTKVIGILSIQSYSPNVYDHQDLGTLQTLADHCGGALERIKAEQALHESEQRFRSLFEGSPDAVFVEDLNGAVLDVNPAGCRLHGLSREQMVGMNVAQLVPKECLGTMRRQFQALVNGRLQRIEGASLNAQGVSIPVEVHANRIEYGGALAILLHVRDITERKQAEAALRSSELLFHSVWENSVDGMRLTDGDGCIVAANEAYCSLVGMPREQLEGEPFTIICGRPDQAEDLLRAYKDDFQNRVIQKRVERKLSLHNGNEAAFEETSSLVEVRGKPPLRLSLFRDVAEQKSLEDQLRQAQKMEAIGQLAGGVAHDFNNILTVISGHAALLAADGVLPGSAMKSARQIGLAAERASGLTRQLLAFSRRQVMQLRVLDINEIVGNTTSMLSRILGEDIALQLEYSPGPALVNADPGMMEQVLLNLAVNSRDAMPNGGALTIRIGAQEFAPGDLARDTEVRVGRFVRLSVIDTGCGITPDNLRRIFEPFFTTKPVGKGTGLGLATVYGIIKQHQGWVKVESLVGEGSTFKLYLPCTEEAPQSREAKAIEAAAQGGDETILVVEDEGPVRELVYNVLERHGYRVLQAQSGSEALGLWNQKGEEVDLLLTDLVMPDRMNGWELAQELWGERPDLKVLFTSGYSADVGGRGFVLKAGLHYLQKPYHPAKLASAVRDCLDHAM